MHILILILNYFFSSLFLLSFIREARRKRELKKEERKYAYKKI